MARTSIQPRTAASATVSRDCLKSLVKHHDALDLDVTRPDQNDKIAFLQRPPFFL